MTHKGASDSSMIYTDIIQHIGRFATICQVDRVNMHATDSMELNLNTTENDSAQETEPKWESVHTSTAAIAAGRRTVRQISRLFEMKVFSGEGALPTGSPFPLDLNRTVPSPFFQNSVCQPLIKQGQGIATVWTMRIAQLVFGLEFNTKPNIFEKVDEDVDEMDAFYRHQQQKHKDKKKEELTLDDCLREFVREVLGRNDLWYCPQCKNHREAKKTIDLWLMPETLVVHLNRFGSSQAFRDKVDAYVDFPIESLDLTDIVASSVEDRKLLRGVSDRAEEEQIIYDLYAVSNHHGGTDGGHYTAYAQNPETKKWLNFDDQSISPVTELASIKTSAAYFLFYKRRHISTITASAGNTTGRTIGDRSEVSRPVK